MAELLAIGKDLKGLTPAWTLNADGSATVKLTGNATYKPELRLTAAEVAAMRKATTPPVPVPPAPKQGMIVGVNGGSLLGVQEAQRLVGMGIGSERLEFLPGSVTYSGTTLAQSLANGFKNQAVIIGNVDDASPLGQVTLATWLPTVLAQLQSQLRQPARPRQPQAVRPGRIRTARPHDRRTLRIPAAPGPRTRAAGTLVLESSRDVSAVAGEGRSESGGELPPIRRRRVEAGLECPLSKGALRRATCR